VGDPIGVLKRIALRGDAHALALRGIAWSFGCGRPQRDGTRIYIGAARRVDTPSVASQALLHSASTSDFRRSSTVFQFWVE
jgi:hypothetical protein